MELTEIEKIAKENYSSAILQNNWNECISFTLFLLDNEIQSENIYILAGLDENDYDDINKYFLSVITDMHLKKDTKNKRIE